MKASYSWLQAYFAEPLPAPDELAALLTEHVFEVEEVAAVGDDTVFDFKVLPDRAHHLLSHRGLAREIAVITGKSFRDILADSVAEGVAGSVGVEIRDERLCRRFMARRFGNLESAETPPLIRTRLEAVGQRCISPLVDISNYVMLDIGQPSHVLDADKVVGSLVVRPAAEGERITVLGDREVELTPQDIVIADDQGPLEIAGVKGGTRAAVTDATRNVIVQCSNYAPAPVRRTATRLNLRSDASKRFENEITPELAEEGMRRLAAHVTSVFPDAAAGAIVDVYPSPRVSETFVVTAAKVAALLGQPVGTDEVKSLLERMDCAVELEGEVIRVTPPTDRFDLAGPEDVADEVGRIRGYNSLPGALPPELPEPQPQDRLFWYGERIKSLLVDRGYSEALLYSFGPAGAVSVTYPLAEDKAYLRENLGERLKERLAFNRGNADLLGIDAVRMCEVGQVFGEDGERSALALGIALTRKRKGVAPEDLIREDLHALEEALGVAIPDATDSIQNGAVCEVDLTALLGKLPAPGTLAEAGIGRSVEGVRYAPLIPYPFVTRDVAVFVSEGVAREEVQAVIDAHAGPLRVRSWCFDEFVKQEGDAARHSFAFRIVFQSPERTLEDAEVNAVMAGVEEALRGKGWEIR